MVTLKQKLSNSPSFMTIGIRIIKDEILKVFQISHQQEISMEIINIYCIYINIIQFCQLYNYIIHSFFVTSLYQVMLRNLFLQVLYTRTYTKYLSKHIVSIIDSRPELHQEFTSDFDSIIAKYHPNDQKIQNKLNIIFNIYCLQQPLSQHRNKLIECVKQGKINSQSCLDRTIDMIKKNIKNDRNIDITQMIQNMSYNFKSQEEFEKQICRIEKEKLTKQNIPNICKILREKYFIIDSQVIYKRVRSLFQQCQQKNEKYEKNQKNTQKQQKQETENHFWDKIQNIKPRLLADECNDRQIYRKHMQITGGQLRFRFPPEPNGYLHIGHIKAIRINFETAKRYNGICYLRYDDTNPQTESHQYIENIRQNIRWLGYQPDRITFASDYFPEMINFAIQLIKEGKAYVCDSPQAQIQNQRLNKLPNIYRNRSIEQSLSNFPNLQEGQTLRLKLACDAPNPTLRDPVIYRIKNKSHPRTGQKFRIYPTYDFAHCICDSLEHVDYSLCSLEFQVRRQLYYKILHLLKLYKPIVWEYSRLNVEDAVISKRKIKTLIEKGKINDWNDPRLLTIGGLIKRGYTPQMLISFVDKVNASRAGNQNIIQYSLLEREMKKQLFPIAEKNMMVLQPNQILVNNIDKQIQREIAIFTNETRKQKRKIILSHRIYIQKSEQLFQNEYIILKYFGVFKVSSLNPITLQKQNIQVIDLKQKVKKLKILHWISHNDCINYPVTCFNRLLDENSEVKSDSKIVYQNCLLPKSIFENKQNNKEQSSKQQYWQMQRLGYFTFINNTNQFIRCVTL